MKKMFLFAACLAVLACSCSENEEGTVKDVRASLKINANIGAPAVSRAEKTAWEAGDKLGLYVCNGTLGTPYNQNAVYTNTPFTYSAAGWPSIQRSWTRQAPRTAAGRIQNPALLLIALKSLLSFSSPILYP